MTNKTNFTCDTCYDTGTIDLGSHGEINCPQCPTPKLSFTASGDGSLYRVSLGTLKLGSVYRNAHGSWSSRHADGTNGPRGLSRIDAAWNLANS